MSSKFRCRQLDASKPIPIFYEDDIFDSTEFHNVTNRSVPQLPTGMEKEEETEHHLQQAIFHHRVIPVPEVYDTESQNGKIAFDQLYPPNYKQTRQFIHIHPFSTEQDIPDYDLDSEDEEWLQEHARKGELLPLLPDQFEEMMDRLEKASGLKAVTLQEAKLLLKDDDDLITAVYDYWLNKRLLLQHPLIPQVKSEKGGSTSTTDPYVAFRKRTEKMQTRKNRKNDESSFEKMLKLRRDLARAITLIEMMKRREKTKRELLHLNIEVNEKRYQMEDFSGSILNEINSERAQHVHRPAFAPIIPNHQLELEDAEAEQLANNLWLKVPSRTSNKTTKRKEDARRERRPYKKKKRVLVSNAASSSQLPYSYSFPTDHFSPGSMYSQSGSGAMEDDVTSTSQSEAEDETSLDGYFAFRRNALVTYLAPKNSAVPVEKDEFSMASVSQPHEHLIGRCRRRVGRGGRLLLDRAPYDDEINTVSQSTDANTKSWRHFRPSVSAAEAENSSSSDDDDLEVDVETVTGRGSLSSPRHHHHHRRSRREAATECGMLTSTSVSICAEMLEGDHAGTMTELSVTVPPPGEAEEENIDFLSSNPPIIQQQLEDETSSCNSLGDDFLLETNRSSVITSINNSSTSRPPSEDPRLTSNINSCNSSSTNSVTNITTNCERKTDSTSTRIGGGSTIVQQHSDNSVDFSTKKFISSNLTKLVSLEHTNHHTSTSSSPSSSSSTFCELSNKNLKSSSTSLNSLFCTSNIIKKSVDDPPKKVMNLSSIYIRPANNNKDVSSLSGGGYRLSNSRNNVLKKSQKLLWTNNSTGNDGSSDTNTTNNSGGGIEDGCTGGMVCPSDTVISNGPSSKSNLKCTKVTPILFHET